MTNPSIPHRFRPFGIGMALLLLTTGSVLAADGDYRVLATYRVAGAGHPGKIAVDAENRRLYVPRGNRVEILNADTGTSVGALSADGATDVIVVPDIKRGFVSNGGDGTVSVFDPASAKITKTIKLSLPTPGALQYDPDSKRLFVAGEGGLSVVDMTSGQVTGTVPLQGQLRDMVGNGYGRLYIASSDRNVVHVVDTQSAKFLGDFPVGNGAGPTGLAIDPSGRRLFVACSNGRLPIIDTDIGFTFEELPIAGGDASDVFTFVPQGKGGWRGAVFVVSHDGMLSLVRMNAFINYSSAGQVKLPPGIHSVAFDPKMHRLFVSSADGNQILVIGQ